LAISLKSHLENLYRWSTEAANRTTIYVLTVLMFILGLWRYLSSGPKMWDLWLWDETFYMGNGIYTWSPQSLGNYEGSPLYSGLYKAIGRFTDSPSELFYAVGIIVVSLASISILFANFFVSKNSGYSTIAAAFFIFLGFAMSGPRLIYFAIFLLMAGAALAFTRQRAYSKASILALTSLVACFVRPEFVISFYAFLAAAIIMFAFELVKKISSFRKYKTDSLLAGLSFLGIFSISTLWVFPILASGQRALMAFGQHYSLYWVTSKNLDIDAFLNWKKILNTALPESNSVLDAVKQYPNQMKDFFVHNFFGGINYFVESVSKSTSIFFVFAIIVLATLTVFWLKSRKSETKHKIRIDSKRELVIDLSFLGILAFPTFVSVIAIYPRDHYLIILFSILTIGIAIVLRRLNLAAPPILGLIFAVAFLGTITPVPEVNRANLQTVSEINKLGNMGNLLEADGGWCFYVPSSCRSVFLVDFDLYNDFLKQIEDKQIDSILVSSTLISFAQANQQSNFLELLSNPEKYGWSLTELANEKQLLRRNNNSPLPGGMYVSNSLDFIEESRLGDTTGAIIQQAPLTLLIVPGITKPTDFILNLSKLSEVTGCKEFEIRGSMAPNVPQEAIDRGAAVVTAKINKNSQQISSQEKMDITLDSSTTPRVNVSISSNGNPDTDWFNLQIVPRSCKG